MKKVFFLLILFVIHFHVNGQSFYHDSVTNQYVTEIYLTDSSSEIYNQHLKMHIQVTSDGGDSVQGAQFQILMYSVKKIKPVVVFSTETSISGAYYNNWDANDDKLLYKMMQTGLRNQGIYIVFK